MLVNRSSHVVFYALLCALIFILSISHLSWNELTASRILSVLSLNRSDSSCPSSPKPDASNKPPTPTADSHPNTISTANTNIYDSLKQHAINNTVIIVPINNGMLNYAQNLLCSLKKHTDFDPKQLVFWTLGDEANTELQKQGLTTFHDPSLWGTSTDVSEDYSTKGFFEMMTERPKFWENVLLTGLDLLFFDADIIFYESPLALIPSPGVDLAIASDGREYFGPVDTAHNPWGDSLGRGNLMPCVCAGTFWARSSRETIRLFQIMQMIFEGDPSTRGMREREWLRDDQHAFDVLLNDGRAVLAPPLPLGITEGMMEGRRPDDARMRVRMWDQARVVSGHLFLNKGDEYREQVEKLEAQGGEKWLVHLNWNKVDKPRIEGAKEMGIWELDENGRCS